MPNQSQSQSQSQSIDGRLSKLPKSLQYLLARILSAASRLETSTSISLSISRLKSHPFSFSEKFKWLSQFFLALFSLFILEAPLLLKLFLPSIYTLVILIPLTSQFFLPASPIFSWLLLFASAKYIPAERRPHIWVSVLPTLETIWYGANVSDILTRFGHPFLDVLAWIPYGVIHFVAPFVVAACLFVFGPPSSVKVFATSAGFMNVIGVVIQICIPCAPPWYELREGLTPADYSMKGSPAGLARIDALFGSHGYTLTFTNAPVPFGAFPSLHAGWATTLALFCSYFFPLALELPIPFSSSNDGSGGRRKIKFDARILYWGYCAWLYWCTMYLMHHYLIDLVAGGCLATICFYFFLTDDMRIAMEQKWAYPNSSAAPPSAAPPPSRPASAFGSRRTDPNSSSINSSSQVENNSTGQPSYNQDLEAFPLKSMNGSKSSSALKDGGRSPSRNGFKSGEEDNLDSRSNDNNNQQQSSSSLSTSHPNLERRTSATSATSNSNSPNGISNSNEKGREKEKKDSFDEWGNEDDEEQIGK